jgi:putative membrane protein
MLLWFWHAPGPYATTFSSTLAYWSMHFTVFGSALWLWHGLLADGAGSMIRTVAAGVISSAQMGFLGALITLAPRAFYEPHALTTRIWGLTPLQDQQFGGVIMWVPGCAIFLGIAMLALWPAMAEKADGLSAGSA